MSDDAEWDEFAKLGESRNKAIADAKKRSEPVKPAEYREKKRDSVDSWDFDSKPKTSAPKEAAGKPKIQAQTIKSAGFGDFDEILEGKKNTGNKM
jgi:hypothetical protein